MYVQFKEVKNGLKNQSLRSLAVQLICLLVLTGERAAVDWVQSKLLQKCAAPIK